MTSLLLSRVRFIPLFLIFLAAPKFTEIVLLTFKRLSRACIDWKSLSFRLRFYGLAGKVLVTKSAHVKGSKRIETGKIGSSKHIFLSLSTSVIRVTSLSRAVVL